MVETVQTNTVMYCCEVCNRKYDNVDGATDCENSLNKNIDLEINGEYSENWSIGDYVIYRTHNNTARYVIRKIAHKETIGHLNYPVLNGEEQDVARYYFNVISVLAQEDIDLIRGNDNILIEYNPKDD